MIKLTMGIVLMAVVVLGIAWANTAHAGDWTDPVEVRHELNRCVSYRAKLTGEFLVIQATLEPGWHTFAMDNKRRAEEKLAGRRSLGIDLPTEIKLTEGLELVGPWYQSPPKDFSKPELRWFSWGFEQQALFAAKVRRLGAGPGRITVRGQTCAESMCKNINVQILIPFSGTNTGDHTPDIDLKTLVQVQ